MTILEQLESEGNLRHLRSVEPCGCRLSYEGKSYLNLSSNDYLGLCDTELQREFFEQLPTSDRFLLSNPASRLMTGNSSEYTSLESLLCQIYGREAALVLGSGFLLNSGLLPAICEPTDFIIADKLVHASVIEALRLAKCKFARFAHNDMGHLEQILQKEAAHVTNVYVVTEALFSMDGNVAPLQELVSLKKRYGFKIYLDEAHSFGVCGKGLGLASECGVLEHVDILVATFGKALSSQGAFVVCSNELKMLLINKMRTLIFSTALPPISLMWSHFLLSRLDSFEPRRARLKSLVDMAYDRLGVGESHIIPIMVGSSAKAVALSNRLMQMGYWVNAVRPPTVPEGSSRLRLSLSAAMEPQDIEYFLKDYCSL